MLHYTYKQLMENAITIVTKQQQQNLRVARKIDYRQEEVRWHPAKWWMEKDENLLVFYGNMSVAPGSGLIKNMFLDNGRNVR